MSAQSPGHEPRAPKVLATASEVKYCVTPSQETKMGRALSRDPPCKRSISNSVPKSTGR